MKSYLSIPGIGEPAGRRYVGKSCVAFYKYDGSNLRWEWSKKRGWYKYGTRTRLFDHTDLQFGDAVELFQDTIAKSIEQRIKLNHPRQDRAIVFTEYLGENSFAGNHEEDDEKTLVLFDVNIHRKGLLSPDDFLEQFGDLPCAAKAVYRGNLNREFIGQVRENRLFAEPLNEGVVCKGGNGHKLWMAKVKTLEYLARLRDEKEFQDQLGNMVEVQ